MSDIINILVLILLIKVRFDVFIVFITWRLFAIWNLRLITCLPRLIWSLRLITWLPRLITQALIRLVEHLLLFAFFFTFRVMRLVHNLVLDDSHRLLNLLGLDDWVIPLRLIQAGLGLSWFFGIFVIQVEWLISLEVNSATWLFSTLVVAEPLKLLHRSWNELFQVNLYADLLPWIVFTGLFRQMTIVEISAKYSSPIIQFILSFDFVFVPWLTLRIKVAKAFVSSAFTFFFFWAVFDHRNAKLFVAYIKIILIKWTNNKI